MYYIHSYIICEYICIHPYIYCIYMNLRSKLWSQKHRESTREWEEFRLYLPPHEPVSKRILAGILACTGMCELYTGQHCLTFRLAHRCKTLGLQTNIQVNYQRPLSLTLYNHSYIKPTQKWHSTKNNYITNNISV